MVCIVVCTVNGESSDDNHTMATMSTAVTAGTAVSNGDFKCDSQQQQQHSNAVSNDVTTEVSDALYSV